MIKTIKIDERVAAFIRAVEVVEDAKGLTLRQMCLQTNTSYHAACRARRGDVKTRVNFNVVSAFKNTYPEFKEVYERAFSAA